MHQLGWQKLLCHGCKSHAPPWQWYPGGGVSTCQGRMFSMVIVFAAATVGCVIFIAVFMLSSRARQDAGWWWCGGGFGVVVVVVWMVEGGVDVTTYHRHCCCRRHRCWLLGVVHWVAETCGPAPCKLVAYVVDIDLKRSLSIIDEIDGRSVMVGGGWCSGHWHCYGAFYMFGSTADGVEWFFVVAVVSMHRFCLLDDGQGQGSSLHVMETGATAASQDVSWMGLAGGGRQHWWQKEANKGALASGDPCGPVLWPASWTAALAQRVMEKLTANSCVVKLRTSHLHNDPCYSK